MVIHESSQIAFDLKNEFADDPAAALDRAEGLLETGDYQERTGVVMFIEFARPDGQWASKVARRLVEKALEPGWPEADMAGRAILALAAYKSTRDAGWAIELIQSPRPLIVQRALQYLCGAPQASAAQPLRDYLSSDEPSFEDIARSALAACEAMATHQPPQDQ